MSSDGGFSASAGRDAFEQAAEAFLERCRRGEDPSVEEYASRFPEIADRIRELFPTLRTVERFGPQRSSVIVADPGRLVRLGEYRVLREIGRGGMGIVYEPEQESASITPRRR